MSTALATSQPNAGAVAIYGQIQDPIGAAESLEKSAATLMGAPLDQGRAIALAALCEGITLLDMARRYHWIEGRPSMRSDAMLAEFRINHGGSHKVIQDTPDIVEVLFVDKDGAEYARSLTWEQAQKEHWPWSKKGSAGDTPNSENLKNTWSTPLGRQAMMMARLVSRTLRTICPELVAGVYTPEEMQDLNQAGDAVVTVQQVEARPTVAQLAANANGGNRQPVEVEAELVEETAPSAPEVASDPSVAGSIKTRQVERINELFDQLGVSPEKRQQTLAKRGAQVVRNLSEPDAAALVDRLESLQRSEDATAGE